MRRVLILALTIALEGAGLSSRGASAGVPRPSTSSFPPLVVACPAGDLTFTVVTRDAVNEPINGSQVVLDFSACPNVHLCPPGPSTNYTFVSPTSIAVLSDASGNASFHIEGSGTCLAAVQISAAAPGAPTSQISLTDPATGGHAPPSFASPDQDGDGDVTPADATILASKAADDPTADLNGDGVHDAADAAVLAAHMAHACALIATPAPRKSWGQLKLIYR